MAHFCHFGPVTFYWLDQKTKSDFFLRVITSYLPSNPFLWLEILVAVTTQIYFGKFCYCVPTWKILKHGFSEPLGDPLWPCDSLLLCTGLFIQIYSETLCQINWVATVQCSVLLTASAANTVQVTAFCKEKNIVLQLYQIS